MDMPEEEPPEYADMASEEEEEEEEDEEEFDEEAYLEAQRLAREQEQLTKALDLIESLIQLPNKSSLKMTPHQQTVATSFLKESSETILCCYVIRISGRVRLAVSLNLPVGPVGLVWYFLKLETKEVITADNFKDYACYGSVNTDNPKAVQHFLLEVYQPVVVSCSAVSVVRSHYYQLTGLPRLINLMGAQLMYHVGTATDTPMLHLPTELLNLPSDLDSLQKLTLDVSLLNRIEEVAVHWVEQVHTLTFDQGDASSPLELGLLHEIRYLTKKGEVLQELLNLLESPQVQKVLKYLDYQSSPFTLLLHQAIDSLRSAQARVKETCGQLALLEAPLDRLYSDSVAALTDHMYDVLALLRIIWMHSQHYHQPDVMAELCVRVSWEVTRACQVHLPLDALFSPSSSSQEEEKTAHKKDSLTLVESAIKCCKEWRNCYVELAVHFKEEDMPKVWLPDTPAIFLPVELFVSRCEDLKYIGLSKVQLTRRSEGGVMSVKASGAGDGGAEGELLEEELAQVDRVLEAALKAVGRKSHLVFNLTSKEWLKHFDRFRESMEEVERRYQCVMVAAVQTVEAVAQGLKVLNTFKPLAARKSLFSVFYVMIDHILNLFERDFEEVEKEYVFRSMKVGGEGFYYSKMAKWATDTRKKLEHEVNLLRNHSWLPYYPRLDSIYERWGRTVGLLRGVVNNMQAAWIAFLEPNPARRLHEPVFRWRPGPIQSIQDNFDMQLHKNLEEAAAWKTMNFEVPDSLTQIFNESESYQRLRSQVCACAESFNSLMTRMSRDEAQLFETQIQMTIKTFYPGIISVTWVQQQQVTALMTRCSNVVKAVQEQVTHYLTVNQTLSSVLMETKELTLYTGDDENVYENDGFQVDLEKQLKGTIDKVRKEFLHMEEILDSLFKKLINKSNIKSEQAWLAYVQRIDHLFLDCQREILRKSLLSFEGMLMGSRSCSTEQLAPIFNISVSLIKQRIVCNPSVNRLLKIITSLKSQFSESMGKIPCLLRRFALDKAKEHQHLPLLEDDICTKLQTKLTVEFQVQVNNLKEKLEEWQIYRDLWEVDRAEFFDHYLKKANSVYVFETDIMTFEKKLKEIETTNDHMKVGTFYIDCETLKTQLTSLCKSWISEFEENLFKIASHKLESLYDYSKKSRSLLDSNPQNISSLLSSVDDCSSARQQLVLYKNEFKPVREQFDVLRRYKYNIPSDANTLLNQLETEWDAVEELMTNKLIKLNSSLDNFRKKFSDRSEVIMDEVEDFKIEFRKLLPTKYDKTFSEAKEIISKLKDMMTDIIEKLNVNETLKLLSLPEIDFLELPVFQHDLIAAEKMWTLLSEWQSSWDTWVAVPVWDASIVALQETLSAYGQKIRMLQPYTSTSAGDVDDMSATPGESEWELKEEIVTAIELCKLLVPLTLNLQNANLKKHHWDQIQMLVKTEFDKDSKYFTLGFLQKLNLTSYNKEMAAILIDSAEEAKIVSELGEIEKIASQIPLNLRSIPVMGISILESTSDTNSVIMALNIRLQVLSASHHAQPYTEEILTISSTLSTMIKFLENVEELQKTWAVWEPFFHIPDVRFHLPHATTIFDSLNERWRHLSAEMTTDPFLRAVAIQEDLQQEVIAMSEEFKGINQHIMPYLQDRKEHYPRFWLLSDDDLVAALSTASDGEYAKPFLPKLFTNIAKIKQEKNSQIGGMEIIGVFSEEGEFLELNSYVPVVGAFDYWLKNLSAGIEATLRDNVKQCRNSMKSATMKVDDVIKVWPLQVSVIAFLMHWTMEISRALVKCKGHMNGDQLQIYKKKVKDSLIRLDGCLQGSLPKIMREKFRLFYLTVISFRDFLNSASENKKGLTNENEIPYRYAWTKDSDNMVLQIGDFDLMYSWEYQGLWSPAVITPSVIQSFLNMARILSQGLAVGILGSSGCGKTEISKTMAQLLGRHLVTVACTASITSTHLAQTIFGICQSHNWLLLENVHNLDLDVVPVLGEMLRVLQAGQRAAAVAAAAKLGGGGGGGGSRSSKLQLPLTTLLEGVSVTVSPLAAVLLEMNPSHSSSRQMMNIFKRECRPVVVFSPQLQVIMECLLVMEGFRESRSVSQKLSDAVMSLVVALPHRHRCHLGLRAAATLTTLLRDILKKQPETDEIDAVPVALREYILPQLREHDLPVFKEVFETLFPDFEAVPPSNEVLNKMLNVQMKENNFIVKENYVEKILQLHEAIPRNGVIILFGSSGSGKSTSLSLLHKSYNKLCEVGNINFKPVKLQTLSPLIMEQELLYGPGEDLQSKGNEGYLPHLLHKFHRSPNTLENWIHFEGPQEHPWLENVFSHIHFSKNNFLCGWRQTLHLPSNLKIFVEVSGDIGNLSPADLTCCYPLYFPSQPQLWEDVIQSWRLTIENTRISRAIQILIKKNLPNFISILDPEVVERPSMIMKAKAFVAIMKSLLETELTKVEPEDWVIKLTPTFIFSVIWSFGANVSAGEAAEFEEVVTRMIEDMPEGGIYDHYIDTTTGQFAPWNKLAPDLEKLKIRFPVIDSDIVPTDRIIKFTKMTQILMSQSIPVLLTGAPGSGKTTILNILKQMPDKTKEAVVLSYTACTSPSDIQSIIEKSLVKQGKYLLSCKKSKLHILIDDLHCSEGKIHLHEVLATVKYSVNQERLYSHHSKAYLKIPKLCYMFSFQRKECYFGQEKTQEINQHIDSHWLESFHTLTLPDFEAREYEDIFSALFDKALGHFDQEVKCLKTVLSEGLIYLYKCMGERSQVKCGDHLALIHHPRQILSVLKGLQLGDVATQDRDNFMRHLTHECYRVFHDLGTVPQKRFDKLMKEVLSEYLCLDLDSICTEPSQFLLTRLGNEENLYAETDRNILQRILKDTGQSLIGKDLTFAVYESLIHHTAHLLRLIGSPGMQEKIPDVQDKAPTRVLESIGGHVVLVGPEGCGKKTCARLASTLAGYSTYTLTGTPDEEAGKQASIIRDLKNGVHVLLIIDWNMLEDVRNLKFVNNLLIEQLYSRHAKEFLTHAKILLSVPSLEEAHETLKYIPAISHFYNVDSFHNWQPTDLQNIATQILMDKAGTCFSGNKIQAVSEIMSFIHAKSKLYPSARFLDFLSMYLVLFRRLYDSILDEKEKLNTSIIKFENTQKRVTDLSKQLEEQRAQVTYIQQSCGGVVLKMRNIKSEQGRLEQDLTKNAAVLQRQKDESIRIQELISRDLTAPKMEMKAIHRRLDRITKAEFEKLKSLSRPPQSVELIFCAVLTALEVDPSWNEAKKQMGNGLNFISSIRKISVENINEKVLTRIQAYLKMDELDMEKVSEDSETTATFLQWLHTFEKYVRVYKDYHPLKVQADIISRDIDSTDEAISKYEDDLGTFSMEHQVLMAQLKEKEQHLEAAEEEMKILEGRIQLAQKVMSQLGQDKIHWEEALSQCSVKLRNVFGDAVLAAAYVTYIGNFTHTERQTVVKGWQDKMDEMCIFHTKEQNVVDVLAPLELQVKWHGEGLPLDKFSLENAAVICNSRLPQLILDPHSFLEKWILNWKDSVVINLDNSDHMNDLKRVMINGQTCVIIQEELILPIHIMQVLEREWVESDDDSGKMFIQVRDKRLEVNENFNIIIILKSKEVELNNNIRSLTNVINMQSQQEGIAVLMTFQVTSNFQSDLIDSLRKSEWDLLDRQKQLAEQEETIRNLMSRFDDDVLEESTLMEMLQAACAKATEASKKCHDLKRMLDAAREGNKSYRKIADLLTRLFLIVERFPRLQPSLTFGIGPFSHLIINEMQPQSTATSWGSMLGQNVVIKMLQSLYRHLQEQVSTISLVTVGLILAMWYECHIGLTTPQFCSLLYTPLISQDGPKPHPLNLQDYVKGCKSCCSSLLEQDEPTQVSSRPQWLTERQWLQVLSLSTIAPFQELADHLVTYENLWHVWYITEQPETGVFPKKMERRIRGIAKLILINCLRPDRLDEAAMMYVQRVLKQEVSEATVKALLSVAGKGSATEPIIIYSSAPLDVEYLIQQIQPMCHPLLSSSPESVDVLALGQGREENLKMKLINCVQKGYWLLLKKSTDADSCIKCLRRLLNDSFINTAHKRFQVWMYFNSDDDIPTNLMTSCRKIYLSLPSTVKESIQHLYELLGESRLSTYQNEWSKWCLLSLALFHIAFVTRQTLENNSTPIAQIVGDDEWEEAEDIFRNLITGGHPADNSLIPQLSARLTNVYLAGPLTEESHSILYQLLLVYLSPESINNVPGRVSALTHYTVPKLPSMEEHKAQTEFIYLAQNVSLTGVAPMVILQNQRDEARDINIALRTLNENLANKKSIRDTEWLNQLVELRSRKLKHVKIQSSLHSIMKQEYEDCLDVVEKITSKLIVTDDLNSINDILNDNTSYIDIAKDDDDLQKTEAKLKKLSARAKFLWETLGEQELPHSIRLGLMQEPVAVWAAVTRKFWGESRPTSMEVAVVTRALTAALATKGSEEDGKGIGEEEESPSIVLEKLVLRGACWDTTTEVVMTEELGAGLPASTTLNLTVTQLTPRVRKILKKISRTHRTPVHTSTADVSPALFWVHLPLACSITSHTCLLSGVRLLTA